MPGICGIITRRSENAVTELNAMVRSMCHAAFHKPGTYVNVEAGLCLGWASVEKSFSDCMPVWNEKRDCLLAFYGRHFFDKEDITALKSRNHRIKALDASVLIHLYEERGPEFLRDLNGVYSGVVLDLGRNRGMLFNDRFGLQRVYIYQDNNGVYFSSEAKALLLIRPPLRSISALGVAELVCCGGVMDDRTLFSNVKKMPPASRWSFENGEVTSRGSYFRAGDWDEQTLLGEDYFCARFIEELERIGPRYFRCSSPISVSLPGDANSCLLLGSVELPHAQVPCLTFDDAPQGSPPRIWGAALAKALKQDYHFFDTSDDLIQGFPSYAKSAVHLSDGTALASSALYLYFATRARETASAMVDGTPFAESIETWLPNGTSPPDCSVFAGEVSSLFPEVRARSLAPGENHSLAAILFEQLPRLGNSRFTLFQTQLEMCLPCLDKDILGLRFRAPSSLMAGRRLFARLQKHATPKMTALLNLVGYFRGRRTLKRLWFDLLKDQANSTPVHAYALRNLRAPLGLHRRGTGLTGYYRNHLLGWIKELLLDSASLKRSYISSKGVEAAISAHARGTRDYAREISLLLTIELTYQSLIERPSSDGKLPVN